MSDIIILSNEPGLVGGGAPFGQHATLAYICAAMAEGHNVFIIDHSHTSLKSCLENKSFAAFRLNPDNSQEFLATYQECNEILSNLTKNAGAELLVSGSDASDAEWNKLAGREIIRVRDIITHEMIGAWQEISLAELKNSYVINRLDPMLNSFLPEDREGINGNVYQYFLTQYKKLIPGINFSDPSGKCDKVATEEVDAAITKMGKSPIYTPTQKITLDNFDDNFFAKLEATLEAESKLFPRALDSKFANLPQRIVFKPIDSAQSSGVCGMEFRHDGIDLARLKATPITQLIAEDLQLLYVKENLLHTKDGKKEIAEMVKILLYAQALKENPSDLQELSATSEKTIREISKKLYETDILIQPFLIGVAEMGDIRVNLVSDASGNWSAAGHTFRAQITKQETAHEAETKGDGAAAKKIGSRFTTCFSAGKAAPTRVEYMLSSDECSSFDQCVTDLLWALNGPLKKSYEKCQELGVDFVPVGDGKTIKLGEINHADPALAPVSTALRRGAFKLATELRNESDEEIAKFSEKEWSFLENYPYDSECKFMEEVEKTKLSGLIPMITSLRQAIARQDATRALSTSARVLTVEPVNTDAPKAALSRLSRNVLSASQLSSPLGLEWLSKSKLEEHFTLEPVPDLSADLLTFADSIVSNSQGAHAPLLPDKASDAQMQNPNIDLMRQMDELNKIIIFKLKNHIAFDFRDLHLVEDFMGSIGKSSVFENFITTTALRHYADREKVFVVNTVEPKLNLSGKIKYAEQVITSCNMYRGDNQNVLDSAVAKRTKILFFVDLPGLPLTGVLIDRVDGSVIAINEAEFRNPRAFNLEMFENKTNGDLSHLMLRLNDELEREWPDIEESDENYNISTVKHIISSGAGAKVVGLIPILNMMVNLHCLNRANDSYDVVSIVRNVNAVCGSALTAHGQDGQEKPIRAIINEIQGLCNNISSDPHQAVNVQLNILMASALVQNVEMSQIHSVNHSLAHKNDDVEQLVLRMVYLPEINKSQLRQDIFALREQIFLNFHNKELWRRQFTLEPEVDTLLEADKGAMFDLGSRLRELSEDRGKEDNLTKIYGVLQEFVCGRGAFAVTDDVAKEAFRYLSARFDSFAKTSETAKPNRDIYGARAKRARSEQFAGPGL